MLPSGKTIEVVYFEDQLVSGLTAAPPRREVDHGLDRDLHLCGSCNSDLVFPLDWCEAGPKHWEITLRCPNCGWSDTGIFASAAVERYDAELDHGTESIIADLRRLMHANMEEDVVRFALALRDGHVLPEDF